MSEIVDFYAIKYFAFNVQPGINVDKINQFQLKDRLFNSISKGKLVTCVGSDTVHGATMQTYECYLYSLDCRQMDSPTREEVD